MDAAAVAAILREVDTCGEDVLLARDAELLNIPQEARPDTRPTFSST